MAVLTRCRAILLMTFLTPAFAGASQPAKPRRPNPAVRNVRLSVESLESRRVLSGNGLVDVGAQPDGGLSGKVVFIHGGHGYTADNQGNGTWNTQRSLQLEMVEDLGNKDQMDVFAEYLFRAGATVVPLRPIGHQAQEVVLDNDDPEVSFTGAWRDSTSRVYFGAAGDVPFRLASTSAVETASATYRPTIESAGYYPVYTWATAAASRATDQAYSIHHTGGETVVTVNHRRVGGGPIYLGSYYFESGNSGYVRISNASNDTGASVVADMIRFGNGMGDTDRGGGVSGVQRGDEAGLYWVGWHVDQAQGIPTSEYRVSGSDRSATVSLAPRYAEYMNRSADGRLSDRVFVSFHSNAGGGNARGVLGLVNGNNRVSAATPNQLLLARTLAREVNDDLVAQNGQFEHDWFDRKLNITLDRTDIEFGEINNETIGNEFDATIVETGFHDNLQDAQLLRDPRVREAIARATYQGLVDYFRSVGGGVSATVAPSRVTQLQAVSTANGSVTLSWQAGDVDGVQGDAATEFVVYTSQNGYGFDGGRVVTDPAQTTLSIDGLSPGEPYYFRVSARNAGGESPPSEVIASTAKKNGPRILIVNGFDRLGRSQNPREEHLRGGQLDRVRARSSNSRDYVIQVAEALHTADPNISVDSVSNETFVRATTDLADYEVVVWIAGEESSADESLSAAERQKLSGYLNSGGKLFLSGSEIAWDLDRLNNGRAFFENDLRADYVADDANTYRVLGTTGSIFAGLRFRFDNGEQFYDVNFADVLAPKNGSIAALQYSGGQGGVAAVQFAEDQQRIVLLGFPFETITDVSIRAEVMTRVLEFFNLESEPTPLATDFNRNGRIDAADFTVWRDALGSIGEPGVPGDANFDGVVDEVDYEIWRVQYERVVEQIAIARQRERAITSVVHQPAESRKTRTLLQFTSPEAQTSAIFDRPVLSDLKAQVEPTGRRRRTR